MTSRPIYVLTTDSPKVDKYLSVLCDLLEDDALVKRLDIDSERLTSFLRDEAEISAQRDQHLAKWEHVAGQHGVPLSSRALNRDLGEYHLTPCYLPPSFHYALFQSGWHALDTYEDLGQEEKEAARFRTLEPSIMSVVSIFRGRILAIPDQLMKTKVSLSAREVKHEIYVSGGSFFLVVEVKLLMMQKSEYYAQFFLELLSAAKENSQSKFGPTRRVHGLLTDLSSYYFYSYDPVTRKFAFDCEISVFGGREEKLGRMLLVTNKIFAIVLSGYMEMLRAKVNLTDGAPHAGFTKALELSTAARQLFIKTPTSKEDLEEQATTALALLQQSITLVPRVVALETNIAEPSSQAELVRAAKEHVDKLLDRMIKDTL
ncbi:hypothetical protein PENSPDRAFT_758937 [Peniophora sp. CONT]|nr:hypothetical protein PENSPDRAFT_758937 [Peniophora sp. CONT]